MSVTAFDVFNAMTKADDKRLQLAPLGNILRVRRVRAGTQITIGFGDDVIAQIAEGRLCGGLILCDKTAYDEWKRKLDGEE